jgi:hypothetical protein
MMDRRSRAKRFFLYQCGDSDYYALSGTRYIQQRLPKDIAGGEWRFRRPVALEDLGTYYFEAARLLSGIEYCILNLADEKAWR